MEKEKGNSVLVILLLLVIVIMGICIYLMYNGTIKTKGDIVDNCVHAIEAVEDVGSNSQIYSYNSLKGYYTEVSPSEEGWTYEDNGFNLYLYDNGIFRYNMSYMAPFVYQGYYYIDNNTIKLIYIFSYNSGAGLTLVEGSRTMTITNEGIIVDNEKKEVGDESKVISLAKSDLPQNFDEYKNISSQLNNTMITNKVGSTVPSSAVN